MEPEKKMEGLIKLTQNKKLPGHRNMVKEINKNWLFIYTTIGLLLIQISGFPTFLDCHFLAFLGHISIALQNYCFASACCDDPPLLHSFSFITLWFSQSLWEGLLLTDLGQDEVTKGNAVMTLTHSTVQTHSQPSPHFNY